MLEKERVIVFIDGSNFYHCLKLKFGSAKMDFSSLIDHLINDRQLVRVYYYNAITHPSQGEKLARKQQAFFNAIRNLPYFEVCLGRLEPRGNTYVEKGVDVRLAVEMIKFAIAGIYDTVILISGDADFSHAVQAVKDLGKHVELAFLSAHGCSKQLRQACDKFIEIDQDMLMKCGQQPPQS